PVLMIPGPTELPFPVIQAMNQPPSIQYDRSFDEGVLEPTTLALRDVFQTKNEVIMMPGSGRTALETGALSVIEPGDRVLVVGALCLLDTVSSIAGIDVRTDEWGVDLNMTGSQKCLAAPLGMALVAVSPRAWEVMEHRSKPARSFTYDLLRWKEWWIPVSRGGQVPDGAPRRQPVSMPTHL